MKKKCQSAKKTNKQNIKNQVKLEINEMTKPNSLLQKTIDYSTKKLTYIAKRKTIDIQKNRPLPIETFIEPNLLTKQASDNNMQTDLKFIDQTSTHLANYNKTSVNGSRANLNKV